VAKKSEINKTQAVVAYLKAHPQAKPSEIVDALTKKGVVITTRYATNIKSRRKKKRSRATKTAVAVPVTQQPATPQPAMPVTQCETITLAQIRQVAKTVKAVGGVVKMHELLSAIQDVGGLERFKDLLAAMSTPETEIDDVPY